MQFDFASPITWADIINIISTIAALAAVGASIIANQKASKSLDCSLKMQEQSKSIDLFDKRVAVIEDIKQANITSRLRLELLFSESIINEYDTMLKKLKTWNDACHDLRVYQSLVIKPDGEGGFVSPIPEIEEAERMFESEDSLEAEKHFKDLCKKYEIYYSENGELENQKIYNYYDLTAEIKLTERQFNDQKQVVLNLMQKFIYESILPIDTEGGNSK